VVIVVPELHERLTGSPAIAGVTENVQVVALVEVAVSVTCPPVAGSDVGEAERLTVGPPP